MQTNWKITLRNGRVADQVHNVVEGENFHVTIANNAVIITELQRNPAGEVTQYDTFYPLDRVDKIERFGPAVPVKVPATFQGPARGANNTN